MRRRRAVEREELSEISRIDAAATHEKARGREAPPMVEKGSKEATPAEEKEGDERQVEEAKKKGQVTGAW